MPYPLVRSLVLPAAVAVLSACPSHSSSEGDPAPSSAPAPSASTANNNGGSPEGEEEFKPLHPGHVNQRGPNGGFIAARTAPPPGANPTFKPTVFDGPPEEVKLSTLKEENGHCGELDLGSGEKVVLDCITDDYSMVTGAAKSMASGEDLKEFRKSRKLPAVVDHRKDGTEGPILDQKKTPACTAFSLVAAANHAAYRYLGHAANLSPMHAWARYHSPKMNLAEHDNVNRGLTDMEHFPFDARLANEWHHGTRVEPGLIRKADEHALIEITNITRLDGGSMTEIKSALAAGQDVWFAMKGAHVLQKPKKDKDGESMVSHFDSHSSRGSERSGHAIVLAGYEDTPHGTFYLIHNSWGTKWGTDGYAWIWEKTLRSNISEAFVLQVRPTEAGRREHEREHGEHEHGEHHHDHTPPSHIYSTCHAGLAPDATTTQCVPACSDGGPRVNGVCPNAGECPDGEVNLDGKCELSAPQMDKTLSNGVKVKCGLSGCTYVVPNGEESCSNSKGCTISCAAPRFMLSSGSRGLACNG